MMNIIFILVEPAVAGNIGSAARAIKTMGFSELRLVNPCDYLSLDARKMAHASGEILENAEVFYGLKESLVDVDFSIATTAKQRDARLEFHPNTDIPEILKAKGNTIKNVALVFGREESGLSNDDIRLCDMASTIPLLKNYPSLNLGQAVMLYAYTIGSSFPGRENNSESREINPNEFRTMMNKSKDFLGKIEVDRNPALYNRVLERIALLNEDDIHLLLSILGRLE
jgi:tRNA/rRNA methyltransferase